VAVGVGVRVGVEVVVGVSVGVGVEAAVAVSVGRGVDNVEVVVTMISFSTITVALPGVTVDMQETKSKVELINNITLNSLLAIILSL